MENKVNYLEGQLNTITKQILQIDVDMFAKVTGDYNPVHFDHEFAAKTRFKQPIAHGLLGASLISAVLGTKLPGPGCIYLSQTLKFLAPVFVGDVITAEVKVKTWHNEKKILTLNTRCFNQNNVDVITGEASVLVDTLL